jgi:uncharacterized protein (TIGR03435 family)
MRVMRWGLGLVCSVAAVSCVRAQDLKPMPKDAHPVFEVATIKPSDPADQGQGFQTRGRHVKLRNESVTSMVMFAYAVHNKQIAGGPSWMSDHFDVDGVPDVIGEPNLKQMQEIVQKMLADRFGMKFHREKRELAIYAITKDKGGVKLEKSKLPGDEGADQTGNGSAEGQMMKFTNNSMDDFALGMQYFLDKPVVNETGLTEKYDFTLRWNTKLVPEADSDVPGLFTAAREQLGLRIEATKGQVDVLVIEELARPTAN